MSNTNLSLIKWLKILQDNKDLAQLKRLSHGIQVFILQAGSIVGYSFIFLSGVPFSQGVLLNWNEGTWFWGIWCLQTNSKENSLESHHQPWSSSWMELQWPWQAICYWFPYLGSLGCMVQDVAGSVGGSQQLITQAHCLSVSFSDCWAWRSVIAAFTACWCSDTTFIVSRYAPSVNYRLWLRNHTHVWPHKHSLVMFSICFLWISELIAIPVNLESSSLLSSTRSI